MKYFIFAQGNIKLYIAAFSREIIISRLETQIQTQLREGRDSITIRGQSLTITPFLKTIQRRPNQGITCLGIQLDEQRNPILNERGHFQYLVLERDSFSLEEDDTLSSDLFYPQEELYRSFLTKNLGEVIPPDEWEVEVKLAKDIFINQIGELIAHGFLRPVYKIDAPFLEVNPWSEELVSLKQEIQGPKW